MRGLSARRLPRLGCVILVTAPVTLRMMQIEGRAKIVYAVVWLERNGGHLVKKREDFCADFARKMFIERLAAEDSFVRILALLDY